MTCTKQGSEYMRRMLLVRTSTTKHLVIPFLDVSYAAEIVADIVASMHVDTRLRRESRRKRLHIHAVNDIPRHTSTFCMQAQAFVLPTLNVVDSIPQYTYTLTMHESTSICATHSPWQPAGVLLPCRARIATTTAFPSGCCSPRLLPRNAEFLPVREHLSDLHPKGRVTGVPEALVCQQNQACL